LTQRLYLDLENSDHSPRKNLLIIVKYAIRRLLRIYVPFVLCAFVITAINNKFKLFYRYNTFWETITFKNEEKNHLWTIGPEIKYYTIVPMFVYIFYKLRKMSNLLLFILILACLLIDYNNFMPNLFRRNSVFIKSSVFSLFYLRLEKSEIFQRIISFKVLRNLMGFLTIFVTFFMIRKYSRFFDKKMTWESGTVSAEYYSLLLFIVSLIGAPNNITNILESDFLTKLGKYSFGIYLWHIICIDIVNYYNKLIFGSVNKLCDTEKFLVLFCCSYFSGFLFFHLIENPCVKLATHLCQKLSSLKFFNFNNL